MTSRTLLILHNLALEGMLNLMQHALVTKAWSALSTLRRILVSVTTVICVTLLATRRLAPLNAGHSDVARDLPRWHCGGTAIRLA